MEDNNLVSFDQGWFVIQTYAGYERKVKEDLLERAELYNMADKILRVEIPTETIRTEVNGKMKEVEENLFPGYVLVEMNMTDEAWFIVRNTPNVTGFVGSHGNRSKPTPLFEQEIQDILVGMGKVVREIDFDVFVGKRVRIVDGAFSGFEAPITEINGDKLTLTVYMFGRATPVELDMHQIEDIQA
ncbi:transcription termination/antitermination protein NusG [Lactococcus lactis]|uniref:Transcription termination/antitermination protein NusG n=1 Tax=Lactococcus lactis subsp. lactis TaxID=1360 RepID=A0A1V0P555_LACLL|nr:transcription termination/antitermination protein NusG [Lactococcus lactis]ARE21872.1 transcription termination/antitermination protein NusG [Lactococcus lactis subsp. lactis]MDN5614777.1 transcription termination/antitermination protein NusG [Lactococcus lactis]MDN6277269.1 transcription termination/antitermination protein NusG [Lactococcus lactis]MDN6472886.1 transcription termination/antitermination protein NusG [Lactococcus lactis]MDN6546404.1 transcription termination/antitermination p